MVATHAISLVRTKARGQCGHRCLPGCLWEHLCSHEGAAVTVAVAPPNCVFGRIIEGKNDVPDDDDVFF